MAVVVATDLDEVERLQQRIAGSGRHGGIVVLRPAGRRRLVVWSAGGEDDDEQAAASLRSDGWVAVARPDAGGRLDAWREHTRPVRFGDRLTVCFAWTEHDRTGLPGLIELGPGGFGNGSHPTTGLLVEELMARISGGERVLDVGCGSGVLGLAALALGAASVVAVDIKPAAIEAAGRNAHLNGMADRFEPTLAPPDELDGPFDIVLANVGRAAIVELAPALVRLVAPGGWLAVSGISVSQCSQVAGFLRPLVEVAQRTSGEWAAVVLSR